MRLGPEDAVRYVDARQRLLVHEWRRAGMPHAVRTLTPGSVSGVLADDNSATFGIEAGPDPDAELVAIATVTRTTYSHYAHRARLVSVFVDEGHRGKGLGAAVVSAAVECARAWQGVDFVDLCVSEDAVPARRLYERLGFVTWGRQEDAADVHGRRLDDIHMTLRL